MEREESFRIGLPNRGRLGNLCKLIFIENLKMLHESVLDSRRYYHFSRNKKAEFIFARSKDLPKLQNQGIIDVCITGKDYTEESGENLIELLDLDLCPGVVSILVPVGSLIKKVGDLEGVTIATQLPNIAKRWICENNLQTTKLLINEGANEVFPHLGLTEATLDIVSTGDTAKANDLFPIIQVLSSSGRLFTSENSYNKYRSQIDDLVVSLRERYLKK